MVRWLSGTPGITTQKEAFRASKCALRYFQDHLEDLSAYELNLLCRIWLRLQVKTQPSHRNDAPTVNEVESRFMG
jgi:hypothetical protein